MRAARRLVAWSLRLVLGVPLIMAGSVALAIGSAVAEAALWIEGDR